MTHRDKRWSNGAKFAPYRIRKFTGQLKNLQGHLLGQFLTRNSKINLVFIYFFLFWCKYLIEIVHWQHILSWNWTVFNPFAGHWMINILGPFKGRFTAISGSLPSYIWDSFQNSIDQQPGKVSKRSRKGSEMSHKRPE